MIQGSLHEIKFYMWFIFFSSPTPSQIAKCANLLGGRKQKPTAETSGGAGWQSGDALQDDSAMRKRSHKPELAHLPRRKACCALHVCFRIQVCQPKPETARLTLMIDQSLAHRRRRFFDIQLGGRPADVGREAGRVSPCTRRSKNREW